MVLRRMRNYNQHKGKQWSVTKCSNFYAYVIWDWGVLLSYKCKCETGMQGHNVQLWFKWEFYSISSALVFSWCGMGKIIRLTHRIIVLDMIPSIYHVISHSKHLTWRFIFIGGNVIKIAQNSNYLTGYDSLELIMFKKKNPFSTTSILFYVAYNRMKGKCL